MSIADNRDCLVLDTIEVLSQLDRQMRSRGIRGISNQETIDYFDLDKYHDYAEDNMKLFEMKTSERM